MNFIRNGSLKLFRFQGIQVYVHWSWLVGVYYWLHISRGSYESLPWAFAQYLALFLIVLTHEFGHAFACRQVGGRADHIVLWPLGGVAFVDPPQRPGAMLWSIAAGPLVNVVLIPVLGVLWLLAADGGLKAVSPNLYDLIAHTFFLNAFMLCFNLVPIFPLDGGQILRSLLWFVLGPARSLVAATVIGLIGFACVIVATILMGGTFSGMFGIMLIFILLVCGGNLLQGVALLRISKAPRRNGFACPTCRTAPPVGPFWRCSRCRKAFDTFETMAVCPHCRAQFGSTICTECRTFAPIQNWIVPPQF